MEFFRKDIIEFFRDMPRRMQELGIPVENAIRWVPHPGTLQIELGQQAIFDYYKEDSIKLFGLTHALSNGKPLGISHNIFNGICYAVFYDTGAAEVARVLRDEVKLKIVDSELIPDSDKHVAKESLVKKYVDRPYKGPGFSHTPN